jgi:hypothetical protein
MILLQRIFPLVFSVVVLVCRNNTILAFVPPLGDTCKPILTSKRRLSSSLLRQSDASRTEAKCPVLDDIPEPLRPLFASAAAATSQRNAVTTSMSHDPFRFEWGTWANKELLEELMDRVNEIRCRPGVFDLIMNKYEARPPAMDRLAAASDGSESVKSVNQPRRLQVGGGQDWDVILHVLPQASYYRGRWPTGSWTILKPLIGVTEVAMLRESNLNKKATTKDLRGGSDGRLGGGGSSTGGEDSVKFVGGPIRQYLSKQKKPNIYCCCESCNAVPTINPVLTLESYTYVCLVC